MNAKEKYNAIIESIESQILENHSASNTDIIKKAFEAGDAGYMSEKEQRAFFSFMTGYTAVNYVSERRMMHVYERILAKKRWTQPTEELDIAGVSDQPAFIRKFKRYFGIRPNAAYKQQDKSKIDPPKTWERISDDFKRELGEILLSENKSEKMRFGVNVDAYVKASLAERLQKYYDLNDMEADLAFEIADKNSLDFDSVFEYVYGYVWQYIDLAISEEDDFGDTPNALPAPETRDECIDEDLNNPETINMYFNCELGFKDILTIKWLKATGFYDYYFKDFSPDEIKAGLEHYYKEQEEAAAMGAAYNAYCANQSDEYDEYEYDYPDWEPDYDSLYDEYEISDETTWEDAYDYLEAEREAEGEYWSEYWSEHYGETEQESIYNLNDIDEYDKFCEKNEQELDDYRGDISRRLPEGKTNLNVDADAKKYLARFYLLDWTTSEYTINMLKYYEDAIETINKSAFTLEELVDEFCYDDEGYDSRGFNHNMEHRNGTMYGDDGYDAQGYDRSGFDKYDEHRNGTMYDDDGYDVQGYNIQGYDRSGKPSYRKEQMIKAELINAERDAIKKKEIEEQHRVLIYVKNNVKAGSALKHRCFGECKVTEIANDRATVVVLSTGVTKKFKYDHTLLDFFDIQK